MLSSMQAYSLHRIHTKHRLLPLVVKAASKLSTSQSKKPTYTDGQVQLQFSDSIYYSVQ